ncbi:MAG: hypothetical protein R3C55_16505 [Parvularculaceae bacterium]
MSARSAVLAGAFEPPSVGRHVDRESDYWSAEGIIATDFDSAFNFMVGVNHIETNGYADYAVGSSSLDYFSMVGGTLVAMSGAADAAAAAVLGGGGSPTDAALAAQLLRLPLRTGYSFYVPYF